MTFVDLAHPLADGEVPTLPFDPPFSMKSFSTVPEHGWALHEISFGSHAGTHIDAPSHYFTDGKTLDRFPLAHLVGPLVLLDLTPLHLTDRQALSWADLATIPAAAHIPPGAILVVRTGWSQYWRTPRYYDYPFLTRDVAENILARGVRILAIDTFNPDGPPNYGRNVAGDNPVHDILLGADVLIVENLTNLEALTNQNTIGIFPLPLKDCDGAPARVVAWKS